MGTKQIKYCTYVHHELACRLNGLLKSRYLLCREDIVAKEGWVFLDQLRIDVGKCVYNWIDIERALAEVWHAVFHGLGVG